MAVRQKGLFISFEGGEGAGKSTQVGLLINRLRERGYRAITVQEPGGTPLGQEIRKIVKGEGKKTKSDEVSSRAELLLFGAARAQLVETVIKPSLSDGFVVVADRYADSTVAYQGYGRQIPLELVNAVNKVATSGIMPDLTFLLDLPVENAFERIRLDLTAATAEQPKESRPWEEGQSKFEKAGAEFHRRVRSGFLKIVRDEPRRILVVDASKPGDETAAKIWEIVEHKLQTREAEKAMTKADQMRLI